MKLKIRGLVFVGFAAAVFAQSASAVVPPSIAYPSNEGSDATAKDNLKKTVTSQLYTDETFQERETTGIGYDSSTLEFTEKAVFVPWKYGDGGFNKEYIKLDSRKQLASTNGGTQDTEYVQIVHAGKGVDQHYVELNTAAVTTGSDSTPGSYGQKIADAGDSDATALEKGRLATAKAVYEFVNSELDEMGANMTGNETYHTQKVAVLDATWAAGNTSLTSPYHVTQEDLDLPANAEWNNHIDHWELIVPDSVVAESGSDIWNNGAGPASTDYNDLTTAKAVYDVLTGAIGDGYQRKITTNEASALAGFNYNSGTETYNDAGQGVMVGHRANTNGADSEWYVFGASANSSDVSNPGNNHLSYLTIQNEVDGTGRPKYLINVKDNALAESAADIEAGGTATGNDAYLTRDKLTTAKAVWEYVHDITGGQNLPPMDNACKVDGVHCALVTVYDAAQGEPNDPDYVPAGTHLEWTVMAPGV